MEELSLKEIQAEALRVLMDIDYVCRKNSIRYCILFGTLIGAIRHQGFIPWDDDIDIGMPRPDYEEFLKIYESEGKYRIVNYHTEPNCPYMITRVSNDDFRLISKYGSDYELGIFVDIYPLDGVGNSEKDYELIIKESQSNSKKLGRALEKSPLSSVKDLHNGIKKWLLLLLYPFPRLIGADYYRKKLLSLANKFDYDKSYYVGCSSWALVSKEIFNREWIDNLIELNFEGEKVLAPKEFDVMLKKNYGEYMILPPEYERIGHHFYKIYRKD